MRLQVMRQDSRRGHGRRFLLNRTGLAFRLGRVVFFLWL